MRPQQLALLTLCCLDFSAAFSHRVSVVNHPSRLSLKAVEPKKESSSTPEFDFSDPLRPVVFGEKLAIPFSKNVVQLRDGVVNDGLYSWMIPYLNGGGYKIGSTVVNGIPSSELISVYSEKDKEELRRKAAEDMVNISDEERNRRRELSNIFYKATSIYAGISTILDDGSASGFLYKIAIFLPLTTAYGLQLSAEKGV
jgi:hypothetical protein